MSNLRIISTSSHKFLGLEIAKHLDTECISYTPSSFSNTETRVQIDQNIRGKTIVIVATGSFSSGDQSSSSMSVNDSLMEALLLGDACRRSGVKETFLVLAYCPYSRQDKKDSPRVPISGKVVMDMIASVGINRVITLDLHAGQMQGFTNIPFDNLYAINLFIDYFKKLKGLLSGKYVLISPDNGGAKRISAYASKLNLNYAIMDKRRDYTKPNVVHKTTLICNEDIEGKTGIVIDDMMDTMGTMTSASESLQEAGLKSVIVVATHGIFSGKAMERINNCSFIEKVLVTDTLPQDENKQICKKLETISISNLISEALWRIDTGRSLHDLFK